MKKIILGLFLLLMTYTLAAQQPSFYKWSSNYYLVFSDESENRALEISRKMEAALKLFNELFHFDLSHLPDKFRVRIFRDKTNFDAYLNELISASRSDFVFISYRDPTRSELVGFDREERSFDASLVHYGFIQYFNAMIPQAPLWLEEGMATYLEYSQYDPVEQSFRWKANLIWLERLKKILTHQEEYPEPLSIPQLITIDKAGAQENIDVFYPVAWGLVHFLMRSSDQQFNRLIWDSISALDTNASLAQNSQAVKRKAFSWFDEEELQGQFESFILSLKTFNELIQGGVDDYNQGRLEAAAQNFQTAVDQLPDSYIPYYYLGLIYYDQKQYDQAHQYYQRASELGIKPQLINYALGVNAFAQRKYELAKSYLNKARELDREIYGDKVDSLLKRIELIQ